ncbi:type III-B CRISPR module-associated protein Cmr5 [Amycolatopsis sp. OK19-0408]|uniref:CRISPR type III-B/RAMP module-associated protein Cmr5 n=1 Tax=Amycolatopsis iheyensis TaxID=2945988 RepID=A0A9X2NGI2_9PSEU|nr:type III-B CRISPR module-associated protein Cmr5 [Amycolatopsis iheyensis]MCR6488386.1 type III-B CRISPR module-associated protein Cmr5 [Amycolatopsis iheyensis]
MRLDRDLAVAAARALPEAVDKDYLTVIRTVPVMLHSSGLAAAAAYLLSRVRPAGDGGPDRYARVAQALLEDAARFVGIPVTGPPLPLLDALCADEAGYRLAERRARGFAVWLARLAAARHHAAGART